MTKIFSPCAFAAAATACWLGCSSAFAVEDGLSPYLKGSMGFMAGFVPPQSGLYLTADYYYFHGSADVSVRDGRADFGAGVTLNAGVLQATYVTDLTFLGGTYSAGALIDYVGVGLHATLDRPNSGIDVSLGNGGIGDSSIVPAILSWHDGNLHWNVNLSVYVPTGGYTKGTLSVGKNIWGFMPQFAMTWYAPDSGWDISGALTYVTMTTNEATDYHSGDLLHFDWAVGFHFGAHQQWEFGVAGNVVEQIGSDSGTGAILGPLKAQSMGVGPALTYGTKFGATPVSFSAKWEGDFMAKKTFGGDIASLSATAVF